MIRRKRNNDNGINTYYNIDNNDEIMIGGMFGEILLDGLYKMSKTALKEGIKRDIKSDFVKQRIKSSINEYVDEGVDDFTNNLSKKFGSGLDIHKLIGKLPKAKAGFTPGNYKYMGPYNPLDSQLSYDKKTGKVIEFYVKPKNKLDEISAQHDICYDMGKNKGDCDKKMVQEIDKIAYNDKPWGTTAVRNIINTKQKLGLGIRKTKSKSKSKN